MKGQNNVNVPSDRCHIDMLYMHWIQCSVPLSPSRMCPDYLFMLSQRMCYAVYFREEIESGVTVVIYSLNDNLLAKSLSVIAKSPAWLVGGTAYPLEALMRWTKMQFGGGRDVGVAFSQRRVRLARHAINFSSEVSAVFLLRCVSKRENIYLVSVCFVSASPRAHARVCVCVLRSCPHMMLLPCHACVRQQLHVWLQLECVCGLNSVCVFARWNGMHVYRVAERGRVAACRDDGIGKRSLSLRPTAKPAGGATAIYSLSLSLSLSVTLSLPPSVYLARSPALFFQLNPFFFLLLPHFGVYPFHLFLSLS